MAVIPYSRRIVLDRTEVMIVNVVGWVPEARSRWYSWVMQVLKVWNGFGKSKGVYDCKSLILMVFRIAFPKNDNFIFRITITGGQKIEVGKKLLFFYLFICLLVLGKLKQTTLSQDKTCKKQSQLFFPTNFRMVVPRFKEGETSNIWRSHTVLLVYRRFLKLIPDTSRIWKID